MPYLDDAHPQLVAAKGSHFAENIRMKAAGRGRRKQEGGNAPAVYDEYDGVALQVVMLPHVAVTTSACDELRERHTGEGVKYLECAPDMSMAVKLMFD